MVPVHWMKVLAGPAAARVPCGQEYQAVRVPSLEYNAAGIQVGNILHHAGEGVLVLGWSGSGWR